MRAILRLALTALVVCTLAVGCIPKEAGYDEMGRRIKKKKAPVAEARPGGQGQNEASTLSPSQQAGIAEEGSAKQADATESETGPAPATASLPLNPAVVKQSARCAEHMLALFSHLPEAQRKLESVRPKTVEDAVTIVNVELEKRLGKAALTCPITGSRYIIMDQKRMEQESFTGLIADSKKHPDGTRLVVLMKLGDDQQPKGAVVSFEEAKKTYAEAKFRRPSPDTPAGQCLQIVADLGRALIQYAEENAGKFPSEPDSLQAVPSLGKYRPLRGERFWVCPITKKPYALNQKVLKEGADALPKHAPNTVALIYDSAPHPDGTRCVLTNGAIARLRQEEWNELKH